MLPIEKVQELVGYRFPPGSYKVEHWENYLLTEATAGHHSSSDSDTASYLVLTTGDFPARFALEKPLEKSVS